MKKKTVSITLSEAVHSKLKEQAKAEDRNVSNYVTQLILRAENVTE